MENIKNMPIFEERKLVKSGASLVLSLPRKWLEENGLVDGGNVIIKANGDLKIEKASPENIEKMNKQIEVIRNHLSNNHIDFVNGGRNTNQNQG